ncbi:MAG: AAA family ATPase, partial [Lentisphaeria bacterium]|nr:AAA family ATPase [Lentisphaeria bacterium]
MIIRKCSIDRFGTLSGRTYAFEDGLNVVRGLPEEEAETLQAFIRVMLYGLSEADRTAYTPEEGEGAFGGSLEVSSGDTLFSVQRNFDREAESFKVTRLSDGAAAVYPDLWVAEALGRLPEEKFVN